MELTFGEQVKIVLKRKGMTIKGLAEEIEAKTGNKMSRQNLTQRLGRDNFQEQDMRMITEILGCTLTLNIIDGEDSRMNQIPETQVEPTTSSFRRKVYEEVDHDFVETDQEREMTIGELVQIHAELDAFEETGEIEESHVSNLSERMKGIQELEDEAKEEDNDSHVEQPSHIEKDAEQDGEISTGEARGEKTAEKETAEKGTTGKDTTEKDKQETEPAAPTDLESTATAGKAKTPVKPLHKTPTVRIADAEEVSGEVNPYTGLEYATNSVRVHPKRIGYVQVYDRSNHKWTDMTEWAFLGYQERKKALLGKNYTPPIYLD